MRSDADLQREKDFKKPMLQKLGGFHEPMDEEEYREALSGEKRSLVEFYAGGCGPCIQIEPYVRQKCREKGVNLVKVDTKINDEVPSWYGVEVMPTFCVMDQYGMMMKMLLGAS